VKDFLFAFFFALASTTASAAVLNVDDANSIDFRFDVSAATTFSTGFWKLDECCVAQGTVTDIFGPGETMFYDFGSSIGGTDIGQAQYGGLSNEVDNLGGGIFRVIGNNILSAGPFDLSGIDTLYLRWSAAPGSSFGFDTDTGSFIISTDAGSVAGELIRSSDVPVPAPFALLGLGLLGMGLARRLKAA